MYWQAVIRFVEKLYFRSNKSINMKITILLLFAFSAVTLVNAQDKKPEGLFINSKAPEFSVKDQNGKQVNLKELRKKGPVVLVFYRGNWCPYCNKELKRFEDSLQLIKDKGAELIAISPETQEGITKTVEKTKAAYSVISDSDAKIIKAYDVAYKVDEKTLARYKSFDIDLSVTNGQNPKNTLLPVPALFIISKEGTVKYRYFNEDYKKRPSVKEILDNL
jgi:peroxiredoxin